MIKAEELRLGNKIYHFDKNVCTVSVISDDGFLQCQEMSERLLSEYSGIPISEDFLMNRAGFEQLKMIDESFSKIVKVTYAKNEQLSLARNSDKFGLWYLYIRQGDHSEKSLLHLNDLVLLSNKLEYVHQLQNFHYILTGQELEIKL